MRFLLLLLALAIQGWTLEDNTAEMLRCRQNGPKYSLSRIEDGKVLDTHATEERCEEVRIAAHGGVVCKWFTSDMPVGPEGWNETGWRPTNVMSLMGLGRKAYADLATCLEITKSANGGVVCTNTGLGAKAAHIETNRWCGASSELKYCLLATQQAKNFTVCSFPSSGTGAEAGWIRTRISKECEYQGSQQSLSDCSASIPNEVLAKR